MALTVKPLSMKPLKKVAALAVLLVCMLSISKKVKDTTNESLNLDKINVVEVLAQQDVESTSKFSFQVKTNLIKKIRGASKINAKVFIVDNATGKKNLVSQENIQVKKFEDAIAIKDFSPDSNETKNIVLSNGDKIIGGINESPYAFEELVKNETIYNSYVNSTNKLLQLKRSI